MMGLVGQHPKGSVLARVARAEVKRHNPLPHETERCLKITKRVTVPTTIQVIPVLQMLGLKKGAPLIRAPEYEEHDSQGPGARPRGAVTLSKFPKEGCDPGATALQEQSCRKACAHYFTMESGPVPKASALR